MKIYVGSDHGGFHLKQNVIEHLKKSGIDVEDEGGKVLDANDDYPQFAAKVAGKVLGSSDSEARGILLCRGAQGMSMAANRFKGIRASVVWNTREAQMTRNDNDSNVLCLPATILEKSPDKATAIVDVWLKTPFSSAERHHRRVRQLDELG